VYQLAGSLVQRIWELQQTIGESKTPVEDLDRLEPEWRKQMPLLVEDHTARLLLTNLIEDAARVVWSVSGGPQIVTRIRNDRGEWVLEAEFKAPPKASEAEIAQLFKIGGEAIPPRLQLELIDAEGGRTPCAVLSRYSTSPDSAFAIESISVGPVVWYGPKAALSRKLIGRIGARQFEAVELKGGSGFGDLPWVFVPVASEEGLARFAGEGSVRTRHPEVFVAAIPEPECRFEELGTVRGCNRMLYRVQGEATFAGSDGDCVVRTAQTSETTSEYYLEGATFPFSQPDAPVYLGAPTMSAVSQSGVRSTITDVEWRETSSNGVWSREFGHCIGDVWIRYRRGSELLYRSRARIVPKTTGVTLLPGDTLAHGSIAIVGSGAVSVGGDVPNGSVRILRDQKAGAYLLHFQVSGEPPATVECEIRWERGSHLSLKFPFPARGGRFIAGDGTVFSNGTSICFERIAGVRAEALSANEHAHYILDGQMHARDESSSLFHELSIWHELRKESDGRWGLAVQELDESLRLMLSMTEDLDATFRLKLDATTGKPVPPRWLNVKRFDAAMERDEEHGCARLENGGNIPAHELGELRMEARPLWDPFADAETLVQTEPGVWKFDPSTRRAGPWLIIAWSGNWCRLRPLLWVVRDPALTQLDQPTNSEATTIADVTRIADRDGRRAGFARLFQRLAESPSDSEWDQFDRFIEWYRGLPPITLDLVRFLAANAEAAALALLRSTDSQFELLWSMLENMPFSWRLVSVRTWTRAVKRYVTTLGADSPEILELLRNHVLAVSRDKIPARIRGAEVIGAWIAEDALGGSDEAQKVLRLLAHSGVLALFAQTISEAEERLVQVHASERWPQGYHVDDLERAVHVPMVLRGLWRRSPEGTEFREPVMNAPVAAALACASGVELGKNHVYNVRRMREFDIEWFDTAYENILKIAVGILTDTDPERLR